MIESIDTHIESQETLGDEPTVFKSQDRRRVWMELWALWFAVLIVIRLIVMAYKSVGIHEIILITFDVQKGIVQSKNSAICRAID